MPTLWSSLLKGPISSTSLPSSSFVGEPGCRKFVDCCAEAKSICVPKILDYNYKCDCLFLKILYLKKTRYIIFFFILYYFIELINFKIVSHFESFSFISFKFNHFLFFVQIFINFLWNKKYISEKFDFS